MGHFSHGRHDVDPVTIAYVKSGHGVHAMEPMVFEKVPLGQGTHVLMVPFNTEYFPAGHVSQMELFQTRHLSRCPPTAAQDVQLWVACSVNWYSGHAESTCLHARQNSAINKVHAQSLISLLKEYCLLK